MEQEKNKSFDSLLRNGGSLPVAEPRHDLPHSSASLSPLLPKALSAVLHARQTVPESIGVSAELTLEHLQSELKELKEDFQQMKSQHNKEIKLLMSELDEEKRIRLTLQMELQRMKKHMSK
ncbi:SH3 domain-containing kinase-binding protein 1 [Stigmatopora nigra]